jgi:hypothetical protein
MAYPIPNNILATSPVTFKTAEIRLLDDGFASGGYDGLNRDEAEQFDRAKNIADPRYGNDPNGAIEYLKENKWLVWGKFHGKDLQ